MDVREKLPQRALLAVVHVEDREQAFRNFDIARDNGADGVFLISHGTMDAGQLTELHYECRDRLHGARFFTGCNFLDRGRYAAIAIAQENMDGLWIDNGLHHNNEAAVEHLLEARHRSNYPGTLFGGVAFKGQMLLEIRSDEDFTELCRKATQCLDVVTTSGPTTGKAPQVTKLEWIRRAIGDHPLALASGVTNDNVEAFLPFVDYFLVSTGISASFTELDPELVRELADTIHAYQP